MNVLRLLAVGVATCALTAGVKAEEKKADNAKLLMGSWEATKAAEGTLPVGAVVTFAKDGKMTVTAKRDGKEETRDGTYKLDGDKFTITMKMGDTEAKFTITIKKISDTELVTANDEGKVVEFKKKTK
jgi:uncharacterized protein (TIGR03066 family)